MSTPVAPPVVRLATVQADPLDADAVLGLLDDDASGGVTLFVGRVRDHDAGRDVTSLVYTAHPSAEQRLRDVCDEVAREYDVHGIAAVHRTGPLEIGDAAVVVATSSAHRDVAFRASRALIDTLKDRVPIWKEQHFAGGGAEWVGTP